MSYNDCRLSAYTIYMQLMMILYAGSTSMQFENVQAFKTTLDLI